MENQLKEIFGAWLAAIGTITSAIGSTPFDFISSNVNDAEKDTDTQVNNETIENEKGPLINIIGSWVQAVGSVISLIGQIREESEELEGNYE